MRPDTKRNGSYCLRRLAAFSVAAQLILSLLPVSGYGQTNTRQEKLRTGTVKPRMTKGAPYPAAKPSDETPNLDIKPDPVPVGPKRGDMKPSSPASEVKQITDQGGRPPEQTKDGGPSAGRSEDLVSEFLPPPLFFKQYKELPNLSSSTSSCCPEISNAENGKTIILTANTWMSLSEDGGGSFSLINPTTIFPQDDGGFCCDQVVVYVPKFDMFVWLLQYRKSAGKNRIRLAAQTTPAVRNSNGTSWVYWDFVSDLFDKNSSLDYNDIGVGDNSLWWTTQNGIGRVVVRIPLAQLAAQGVINFGYTAGTNAKWSHLTQNATNTVFWAGHINNSQMRVFDMKDGNGFYSWRTVNINSWPNGTNSTKCPDGTDWMEPFETTKHYVFGNAQLGGSVWFSWLAAAGGGFPEPHVQLVRINPATWTLSQQSQIWNPKVAFQDAYLSTNNKRELGMEIAFGSGGFYPSSAVGVWGDFVVYYPRLSTRCVTRWGDYNHSRRAASDGAQWTATGYTNEKNATGGNIVLPHYIRFGR